MNYSFIIPVYNCKEYLSTCVESIRAVGAQNYEILLIDDGATDGSGEVCDQLAEKYPEIRVIHQTNRGASAARNRGIEEARGEKILFFDADDSINSAALSKVLSDSRCGEADLAIFGLTFDYYHNGKIYRQDPLFFEYDGILERHVWSEVFRDLYIRNSLSPVWNKIFNREILTQHQLELNTAMFLYEDFEFVLRYLRYCDKIWNVPQAIYHYRQSEDEGNAKRRLARIGCLSEFLQPIEAAMDQLIDVVEEQKSNVLIQLFQVLAREKISVSKLKQIRGICEDYAGWYQCRGFVTEDNVFHRNLMNCKAGLLLLGDKKNALRHKIAVWAKAHHLYKRK